MLANQRIFWVPYFQAYGFTIYDPGIADFVYFMSVTNDPILVYGPNFDPYP